MHTYTHTVKVDLATRKGTITKKNEIFRKSRVREEDNDI